MPGPGRAADAHADGLAFDFACGDEVYGSCTGLRQFPEGRGQAHVLRVASDFALTLAAGTVMTCAEAVRKLLGRKRGWEVRKPPGHAARWLQWRRRHQARSRWFHKHARLERNYALVS